MSEVATQSMVGKPLLLPRQRAGRTAYRDNGTGEAVVFIHGVGLNADAWQPQIAVFAKTHRVIVFDMLGHGESGAPDENSSLDSYVRQVAELLAAKGVAAANIIGHSMGGLVALGFALAHPEKTLRLAVLNSVYRRTPEKRAAVLLRARDIKDSGQVGNIEEPLTRWFGEEYEQLNVAMEVRHWLMAADPKGYATAYNLFALGDEFFVGRLKELKMPALFATGSDDQHSTPAMAAAMASEVARGSLMVLDGARHMMNLTHADEVNAAIKHLLNVNLANIDSKDLRAAFSSFLTGVTVVTTREPNGNLRGFTANSFSSVSLDPPLLLICVSKAAASCDVFSVSPSFAVNILSEAQKETSGIFASKRPDKFTGVEWTLSALGNPILAGSMAWFDCARHSVVEAGDHLILIGRVSSYAHTDASPLGYGRGGYFTLGLEQSAINAATLTGHVEVGAILEHDGKLVVFPASSGRFELPHVGRSGETGSAKRLLAKLGAHGTEAKLDFLFAVFENREDHSQSIYYRGDASHPGDAELLDFADLPWSRFRDDATRTMLKRYCNERQEGRYKIYSGDHVSGAVRDVST